MCHSNGVFVVCGSRFWYWWLRAPNPTNANNERNVNTSGALNNNNANNGNGLAADYTICSFK